MILFHKSFRFILLADLLFFLCILCGSRFAYPDSDSWLSGLFFDKLYVCLLAPVFMSANAAIDNSLNIYQLHRAKSRLAFLEIGILQKYLYAFVYMSLFFILIFPGLTYFFPGDNISAGSILTYFFPFLWGLFMLINLADIIKLWSKNIPSTAACAISYGLMLSEMMILIPETNRSLPVTLCLVFGWTFHTGIKSFLIQLILLFLSWIPLYFGTIRKDWFH